MILSSCFYQTWADSTVQHTHTTAAVTSHTSSLTDQTSVLCPSETELTLVHQHTLTGLSVYWQRPASSPRVARSDSEPRHPSQQDSPEIRFVSKEIMFALFNTSFYGSPFPPQDRKIIILSLYLTILFIPYYCVFI